MKKMTLVLFSVLVNANALFHNCLTQSVDYDSEEVLSAITLMLNESIPEKSSGNRYGYKSNRPMGYFIYDLVDTLNTSMVRERSVTFSEGHIYHFSPFKKRYAFSHILILHNGKIEIFRAINCRDKGDSLKDVFNYIESNHAELKISDPTLGRIKNYRSYGKYRKIDRYSEFDCGNYTEGSG